MQEQLAIRICNYGYTNENKQILWNNLYSLDI